MGDSTLTTSRITYQIQRLNTYDPEKAGAINHSTIASINPGPHSHLACQTLDLMLYRLLEQSSIVQPWVEKIVVMRLYICSLSLHARDHLPSLENLFEDIAMKAGTKLGPEATHASQSVSSRKLASYLKNFTHIMIADMESCHYLTAITERGRSCKMVQFGESQHLRKLWRDEQSQIISVSICAKFILNKSPL